MRGKKISNFEVRWNARKDGKRNIPASASEEHPPYVKSIIDIGQRHVDEIARLWEEQEKTLEGQYRNAVDKKNIAEVDLEKAEVEKETAEARFMGTEADLRNLEHVSPGKKWYWVFFIFLIIVEFPINSFAFQIFGESIWLTILLSLLICFAIPYSAHMAGMELKSGVSKSKTVTIKFFFMIFIVVGILITIAYMREKFFEGAKPQEVLGVELDNRIITLLFFLINGLVFLIAMWTSYNAHPKDPKTYHTLLTDYDNARKNKIESFRKYQVAKEAMEKANETLNNITAKRKNGFDARQNEAYEYVDRCRNTINYYRTKNLQIRPDNTTPRCFEKDIVIKFPNSLEKLDWV
jgi:hypothetical protein